MNRNFKIIRSKRKSISLVVSNGEFFVRAPKQLSLAAIQDFVIRHSAWIEAKLSASLQAKSKFDTLVSQSEFMLLGLRYPVELKQRGRASFDGQRLLVCAQKTKEKTSAEIIALTKKIAGEFLLQRTRQLAHDLGIEFVDCVLTTARKKWGSCDTNNKIRLNWRIVMLPENLIDYVIIHELCHVRYHNHSAQFWALVASHCADYKALRKLIKDYTILNAIY